MEITVKILEILYYIAGIGLFIIGMKGLKQLTIGLQQVSIGLEQVSIAKQDIEIRSQREAALLAVNQSEIFSNELIPLWNNIYLMYKAKDIPIYKGPILNFDLNESEINSYLQTFAKTKKFKKEEYDDFIQNNILLANKLEAVSLYFVKGIADEQIVFESLSKSFQDMVKILYPIIVQLRQTNKNAFSNLIELFCIWGSRFEEKELLEQKEKISDELEKIVKKDSKPTIGSKVV
ncbi:DUF4760 domain-containing protein [Mesobacillus jeotgali]|uniref:DUF4760 domain-containing protein n=1 Tax=Mesobacillus jeotgali TaxID=129985 RepID=UPI001CFD960C|nr:hypothetical protein [Mesobacillus jeotgali]